MTTIRKIQFAAAFGLIFSAVAIFFYGSSIESHNFDSGPAVNGSAANITKLPVEPGLVTEFVPEIENPAGLVDYTGAISIRKSTFAVKVILVADCADHVKLQHNITWCGGWATKHGDYMYIVVKDPYGNYRTRWAVFMTCNHEAFHIHSHLPTGEDDHEYWDIHSHEIRYRECYELMKRRETNWPT